jgi:hypothetical protein
MVINTLLKWIVFRKEFLSFLRRTDEKEEYVLQWQNHYNDVSEDMRADDEVKAELHQEVDVRYMFFLVN